MAAEAVPTTTDVEYTFGDVKLNVKVTKRENEDKPLFDDGSLLGEETYDETGLFFVWPAAVSLCQYLSDNQDTVRSKRVLELGAGIGLPSLLSSKLGAEHVVAIDMNQDTVNQLTDSFKVHDSSQSKAVCMDWESADDLVKLVADEGINVVICSDVIYPGKDNFLFLGALTRLRKENPALPIFLSTASRHCEQGSITEGLEAIGSLDTVFTDDSQHDPLYGATSVKVIRIR